MSFNFGPTLLSWMQEFAPMAYERIIKADIIYNEKDEIIGTIKKKTFIKFSFLYSLIFS